MTSEFKTTVEDDLQKEYRIASDCLTISLEAARELADNFNEEIRAAIEERGKGVPFVKSSNVMAQSLACIDAFSDALPSGNEQGYFYAIDLGGSNLRAVAIRLEGRGESSIVERKKNLRAPLPNMPNGLLDKSCTAKELFDEIARTVGELIEQVGESPLKQHMIAFTFSFPLRQDAIDSGELICWTKEFETGNDTNDPVVGQDVALLMNQAFQRNGLLSTKVACLINDTVGTMLSAGYSNNHAREACRVGVILGTGFNICYMDKVAPELGYKGTIVNLECGGFNKLGDCKTLVDEELDFYSSCRGQQWAEKMISGLYLGEICRLYIVKVFQSICPEGVFKRNSFETVDAAAIYNDRTKKYSITKDVVMKVFGWDIKDEGHLRIIYKLVCLVFTRSATLGAILTYVCCLRTKFVQRALGGTHVGIDGSLYILNKKYQSTYRKTIQKLLGLKADLVSFSVATDGSGKGAAIMAACSKLEE